jgi:hypothetical protein
MDTTITKLRKLAKVERDWLKGYKDATSFEAMHIDELKAGTMTFEEVVDSNTRWFEQWSSDALLAVTRLPVE